MYRVHCRKKRVEGPLHCPHCSAPIALPSLQCRHCIALIALPSLHCHCKKIVTKGRLQAAYRTVGTVRQVAYRTVGQKVPYGRCLPYGRPKGTVRQVACRTVGGNFVSDRPRETGNILMRFDLP